MRASFLVVVLFLAFGCGVTYSVRHRVEPGENLGSIARRHGVTEQELRRFNRLEPGDQVEPGDIVFLPGAGGPPSLSRAEPPVPSPPPRAISPAPAPPAPRAPEPVYVPPSAPSAEAVQPPLSARLPAPPAPAGQARLRWPVPGPVLRGFGTGPAGESRGIDIGAAPGSPVGAADRGTVTYAGTPASAYGPLVILEHEGSLFTVYGNLRDHRVERGQRVDAGQVLGTSGSRDPTLPPHLHFEVRRGQDPTDPLLFLPPR